MRINETISSPNHFTRGDRKPQLIVYHLADGTYEGTKSWFLNAASQTSSNFIVARDGRICQCVPILRGAWCNGTTGDKAKATWWGHSTVPTVLQLGGNANQYSVSIECEGFWRDGKGALTAAQLDALVWLTQYICSEVRKLFGNTIPFDRNHLVGHYEVNSRTKPLCPGEAFPLADMMARLNGTGNVETNTIYRIQVGAFRRRANAEVFCKTVEDKELAAFVTPQADDGLFRVQIGAFSVKANAEVFVEYVKKQGLDAFVVVSERKA